MAEPDHARNLTPRDRFASKLVVGGSKLSVIGALSAFMGVAQALSWIRLEGNHASEMGIPSMIGAGASALCVLAGLAIAGPPLRRELLPTAGRWLGVAAFVAGVGALLLST